MNKLILLRHGQSQWNLENRFTGWTDVPLTENGELEAKKAGELLKKHKLISNKVKKVKIIGPVTISSKKKLVDVHATKSVMEFIK